MVDRHQEHDSVHAHDRHRDDYFSPVSSGGCQPAHPRGYFFPRPVVRPRAAFRRRRGDNLAMAARLPIWHGELPAVLSGRWPRQLAGRPDPGTACIEPDDNLVGIWLSYVDLPCGVAGYSRTAL